MKRLILIIIVSLLVSVPVMAQERPIAGTTVQTTDTSANSLLVGCVVGSTTCTGGIKSGPIVATGLTLTSSSNPKLIFTTSPAGDGPSAIEFNTSNAVKNWRIGANLVTTETFTLTPSTAAGGTTYTTPVFTLTAAGALSLAGPLTITGNSATFGIEGNGTNGIGIEASNGSGAIRFYSGGANLRWGINSAGDHTFGTASHISDSSGTPTISSGFGASSAIAGNDYAFTISESNNNTGGTVNFGHTWTSVPVCTVSGNTTGTGVISSGPTTTQLIIATLNNVTAALSVLCRGY